MKFGVCIPNFGLKANKEAIEEIAKRAEELNYDSLWLTDHILVPKIYSNPYGNTFEILTTLAYLSGKTERIKLGTSILVLPLRNPIIVTKQLVNIDILSGGRLILGVAIGWMEEEFKFLNSNFKLRRRIFEENLSIIKALWKGEEKFEGRFYSFKDAVFLPKPIQKDLPIWIGGNSDKAIERAIKFGNAWHPVGLSPLELREKVNKIRSSSSNILISMRYSISLDGKGSKVIQTASGEKRYRAVGSTKEIIEDIEDLRRAGLEYLVCYFGDLEKQDYIEKMKKFAKEVIPSFTIS